MEFNKFELILLLILVEGKISDLKFNLLELNENRLFMYDFDFEQEKSDCVNALKSTNELLNKIKKYLEE